MATEGSEVLSVEGATKAGFWVRVGAYIVDGILLAIIGAILRGIFGSGVGGGLSLLVGLVYFVYFWTNGGQTIGLKALHLRVIKTTGTALTVSDAIIRYIGLVIAFVVVFIGVMWVGWDSKKQGWHDKMAGTFVIKV